MTSLDVGGGRFQRSRYSFWTGRSQLWRADDFCDKGSPYAPVAMAGNHGSPREEDTLTEELKSEHEDKKTMME